MADAEVCLLCFTHAYIREICLVPVLHEKKSRQGEIPSSVFYPRLDPSMDNFNM